MAHFCIAILLLALIRKIDAGSTLILCKTPTGQNGFCTDFLQCPEFILHHNEPGLAHHMQNYQCGAYICRPITKKHNLIPNENICGISKISAEDNKIVGGYPAKLGAWPWIVALGEKIKGIKGPFFVCGGSLITDRHVITAAHCVYRNKLLYMVRIADLNLETDNDGAEPEERKIKYKKYHEKYNPTTIENDIAILGLDGAVKFTDMLRPICLPIQPWIRHLDLVKKKLHTAGWGCLYTDGPYSPRLMQVQIPVVSNEYCEEALYSMETVTDERVICAGYRKGGKDACQGDSGGPLVYIMKNRTYLMGIVSYGDECALPGKPGVYTRVTEYLDWIEKNIY